MALTSKFSAFVDGGALVSTDVVVGIRAGVNTRFTYTSSLVDTIVGTANEIDVNSVDPENPILSLSSTIDTPGTFTIQSTVALDSIIDDDTFATATATNIPTSESVKAYVDGLAAGHVESVTGTANEIDVDNTAPQNPVLSLSSTILFPGTAAFNDGDGILTGNGNNALLFNQTATAVNYFDITPAATGNGPLIQSVGTDANVDFNIESKGTGNIILAPPSTGSVQIYTPASSEASGVTIAGVSYDTALQLNDIGLVTPAQFVISRHSTTLAPIMLGVRSNDNTGTPLAVTAGQDIYTMLGAGYTGTTYNLTAGITLGVDTTGTINNTSLPGQIKFQVAADGTVTPSTAVTITNDKTVTFAGDLDAAMTNGELLIGDTGNVLAKATLTAGTGVSITNAAGSITINATGSGMSWETDATGTIAAAVDSGYVCGNAGVTQVTLPVVSPVGSVVIVEGLGAGGWVLNAGTAHTIQIGPSVTSAAGSLTSAAATDNVTVISIVANSTWRVQTTNSAGLTIA